MQGGKIKNLQVATQKLKALHNATSSGAFLLDPIVKPAMTERNGDAVKHLMNRSQSFNALTYKEPGNKALILKMVRNFDID
jgi:hypothetical protein